MSLVQVKFFEVSEDELVKQRSAFAGGNLNLKIESKVFSTIQRFSIDSLVTVCAYQVLDVKKMNQEFSQPKLVEEVKETRARQAVGSRLCFQILVFMLFLFRRRKPSNFDWTLKVSNASLANKVIFAA